VTFQFSISNLTFWFSLLFEWWIEIH
jgi:hypothetical protein